MNPLVAQALAIAGGEVGVREAPEGSNRGPRVDAYLASVGLAPGNPWCAAFAAWCIQQAAWKLGVEDPWDRSGSCAELQRWAREKKLLRADPQPGDVFLLLANGRAHHTGFVVATAADVVATYEGNTNLGGSPEGIGVFRRSRHVSPELVFIRWEAICPVAPLRWRIKAGSVELEGLPAPGDLVLAPVRALGEALGRVVEWRQETQRLLVDGRPVPVELSLIGGVAYAPLMILARQLGLHLAVDNKSRHVVVTSLG